MLSIGIYVTVILLTKSELCASYQPLMDTMSFSIPHTFSDWLVETVDTLDVASSPSKQDRHSRIIENEQSWICLLYTSPSPRD